MTLPTGPVTDAEMAEAWTREQINALGAFLVSRCGVPIERAGSQALEMVRAAGFREPGHEKTRRPDEGRRADERSR